MFCDHVYIFICLTAAVTGPLACGLLIEEYKVPISRLLRHGDVDQSQTVSKSADFRCEKMHLYSSESRESRIFGISALKTIVLKNKTKLFFDLKLVN